MNLSRPFHAWPSLALAFSTGVFALFGATEAAAGTATDVNGLYYTGVNNGMGLLPGASTDSHWTVTYATGGSTYEGSAYVVSTSYIDGGWTPNTSTAQWIVPPGAKTSGTVTSATNAGGAYLPGNGTSGANAASFVYSLAFNIAGSGTVGSAVTNKVSITLTLAADDQAKIYVNPSYNGDGSINTTSSTLGGSLYSAWSNTSSVTLQNYGAGKNANFVIGTNYLVIQVDNTNSLTGTSGSTALNPSGLLVYQLGSVAVIDGKPVPEVGSWIPVIGALALLGWHYRRSRSRPSAAA